MRRQIAGLAVVLFVVTVVTLAPAWPRGPKPARAQTPLPDLVLTKSDSPDPVASGDPITYSIVVTNNGTASAGSASDPINIIDQLPTQFSPTPSFSIAPTGSCSYASGRVNCQVDTLAPGDSVKLTIDGYVTLPFGGQVKNIGFVDLPVSHISETIEVTNNIESETTTILAITTATATATPSDTPTPTPTATPTLTPTTSPTATPTSTPTRTPKPVGGVSNEVAGGSPEAVSDNSRFPDGVPIRSVIGVVAALLAASAGARYVKRRTRA